MHHTDRSLSALFERSPIGMYRTTRDGIFVYANPALAKLLGYATVDELLAKNIVRDIYVDPQRREALVAQFGIEGTVPGVDVEWRRSDGSVIVVQLFGHVIEGDDGTLSFDASVIDVTDARRQRAELDRIASILELVVEQVPAVYWLVDLERRIYGTGGAIERVLGYRPDRWVGATIDEVHQVEPGSNDPIAAHARALAGEVVTYSSEYRDKHLSLTIAPHRDRDGQIVGAIGTAIDVTAARAMERRIVDAQRAESLGVLAGGLAHDFNNLLVAILGNADLGLRDVAPGNPGRLALENVRHASLRAAELTGQLLAYAGQSSVATTRVVPRAMIDELLRIAAPTIPDSIALELALPSELAIRADAQQVRQVFMNLVVNARDALAARGGRITITGRLERHDGTVHPSDVLTPSAGAYVVIEFADDGPGIDHETRRRIFEPFFTTKATGHGLGLAAVLGIVRAHNGGLRLASEVGEGARFGVWFPATSTPVEVVIPVPALQTILVIDDEDLVRDVVARMIEDLGYAAVTAEDGYRGLEIVEGGEIDAVLVDLTMPRMSGNELVAALREKHPELPVILCTGFDLRRKGPVQADAYLPKPFRLDALEATLAKVLRTGQEV